MSQAYLVPRPPREPGASRPPSERIALSLIVGFSEQSQIVLIKFRFIRGATETVHLPSAVAATLLDGLTAAESEKAALWDAATVLNVNAKRLLAVVYPRFTDDDSDAARAGKAISIRLGIADNGAVVEFTLSNGAACTVGVTPAVARYLREQLQACESYF